MSDADEVVYDELPEAIRIVHAALLVPERVAEAVPLALQLLAHGGSPWIPAARWPGGGTAWGWSRT